jgi:ribA/ribD-fused uncharacterized protein
MGGSGYCDGVEYPQFDNFYECCLEEDGIQFASTEHYYQYHKCILDSDKKRILASSVEYVFSIGQSVELVPHWESIKLKVMYRANQLKFNQHPDLAKLLISTEGEITVPSCVFGSMFWGSGIDGTGENWNGKILMAIRDQLKGNTSDEIMFEISYRSFLLKLNS